MSLDLPGFADPVLEAQSCFRAVLDAMARPGHIRTAGGPAQAPSPLHPATAAVLLTLVDAESSLWLEGWADAARGWIAFHCGAPFVGAETAAFALLHGDAPPPGTLPRGTDDAPELGATLIVQVASFGRGRALHLSGPGLAGPHVLRVDGLSTGILALRDLDALPCGIDMILCAGDQVAALPRTTRIMEA